MQRLEGLIKKLGEAVSWLNLLMTLLVFVIVVCRYAFGLSWVWLQELSVYMHAMIFMSAAAFSLQQDQHVRVDLIYSGLTERKKYFVQVFGVLVFLIPVCLLLIYQSWFFVRNSWQVLESSKDPNGLPGLFLLKSLLLLFPATILLQGILLLFKKGKSND